MSAFDVRKAAHVAAFFTKREGGSINVLKLVKLIYLADRKYMERYDTTILNDRFVSMNYGPVNSTTLNYINGCQEDHDNWECMISDRAGHEVGLSCPDISEDDLTALSDAEIGVLSEIWLQFGHMDRFEIAEWTHDNCPEWEDPEWSSTPIPFARIFGALGKTNGRELAQQIEAERVLDRHLAEN